MSVAISDVTLTAPDKAAVAESIVNGAAALGKNPPKRADLQQAIQSVSGNFVRAGAPSLQIVLLDPVWHLLDSDLFDADEDGRLDPLLMNYPQGSRYWWVCSNMSPSGSAYTITTTWIPRLAWAMQRAWGPEKANRASMTRAEFLKGLVLRAAQKHGFVAEFYSKQLDVNQPIVSVSQQSTQSSSKQPAGKAHKTNGVSGTQAHLTCNGKPLTTEQMQVVNIALGEAEKRKAPRIVVEAMIYAAMGEHDLSLDDTWQNSSSDTTEVEAHYWLVGGHGFQQGGGIQCAKDHPHYSAWQIANAVEANAVWNASQQDSYAANAFNPAHGGVGQQAALQEAAAIVSGGGYSGSQSGSYEVVQPYYFQVGTTSAPNEAYWDAAQRLVQEAAWDFIIDGDRVYYDSEMTLIKQKVALSIKRGDLAVTDWSYDWESRNIATNFQLSLMADMFAFAAGDVIELVDGFGTASRGSTAKRPGCWLVDTIARDKSSLSSQLTLVQPTAPKKEPAPTVKTVNVSGSSASSVKEIGGLPSGSAARALAAAQVLSNMKVPYNAVHYAGSNDDKHPKYLDCSSSTSWVVHQAGMFPSANPIVSGDFESWGDPGQGQEMTVWCNGDHVFIEFHLKGGKHLQCNTSYPGVGPALSPNSGARLIPWGSNGESDANSGRFVARHWRGA